MALSWVLPHVDQGEGRDFYIVQLAELADQIREEVLDYEAWEDVEEIRAFLPGAMPRLLAAVKSVLDSFEETEPITGKQRRELAEAVKPFQEVSGEER